jgi:hypothetical protein
VSEWIAGNIVQIIVAAVGFGAIWKGQQDNARELLEMRAEMREFWQSEWPSIRSKVEVHDVKISALERSRGHNKGVNQ